MLGQQEEFPPLSSAVGLLTKSLAGEIKAKAEKALASDQSLRNRMQAEGSKFWMDPTGRVLPKSATHPAGTTQVINTGGVLVSSVL